MTASFDDLVAPHRPALLAHCYRMTGSFHDAEDALQDALLRAWRAHDAFEGRSSLRTWLFTIATNSSRRLVEQRSRRMLPVDLGPAAAPGDAVGPALEESLWITPYVVPVGDPTPTGRYEAKESVELAFVAALQLLAPRQRAVLLLRDVLGFSAAETATALDSSVDSVTSALARARRVVEGRAPELSQQRSLRLLGPDDSRAIVERYVRAWQASDIDALVRLLADDVELAMPPYAAWFRGIADVAAFLVRAPLVPTHRWIGLPIEANGQLACAMWVDTGDGFVAEGINVLTVTRDRISAIDAFRSPDLFAAFGLPATPLPIVER